MGLFELSGDVLVVVLYFVLNSSVELREVDCIYKAWTSK